MPSTDEVLQNAVQLCQAGEKQKAAKLLVSLICNEPTNEQGWWLLTACVDTPKKQRDCLERVLQINPEHLGARMFLFRLDNNQPLPDLSSALKKINEPLETNESNGYSQTAPFKSTFLPPPVEPHIVQLMDQAKAAEESKDFAEAYQIYQNIIEVDSSHALAWLGKGYAAGRLSTADQNGISEFFDCFSRAVLSHDQLGLTIQEAITRLEPSIAQAASNRLLQLASYSAQLAMASPQPMANVYAVERVHLTDWAYAIGQRLSTQEGLWCSRAELISVARDAFQRIIQSVVETNRSTRARQEILQTLKNFILSNLNTSGIDKDIDFLNSFDDMLNDALK
ncbi:MAG: hypothetical protein IH586_00210 [Anaerolineaceae bacterium]|nr:hypothetical protein [Anaerolineaceae bacterium]